MTASAPPLSYHSAGTSMPGTSTASAAGMTVLEGMLDEESAPVLAALSKALATAPSIELDVGGLRRINSLGVRAWVDFVRSLGERPVTFRRCSPSFVDQLNTVSDFRGGARVASFLAPYVCETSGNVFYEELIVGRDVSPGNFAGVDRRPCKECPEPLVFDDLPERYFQFLSFD